MKSEAKTLGRGSVFGRERAAYWTVMVLLAAGVVVPSPRVKADSPVAGLHPRVAFETTQGSFVLELDAEKAPVAVSNFVQYVEDGHYDGLIFHRVVKNRLIQGGAFTPSMESRTAGRRDPVENEWQNGLLHERGTVAMYSEFGRPHSVTDEFFINLADNPRLNSPSEGVVYPVFGRVVEGMDTVERIGAAPLGTHPKYAAGRSAVVPVEPVVINSARMLTPFDRAAVEARQREAAVAEAHTIERAEEHLAKRIAEFEKRAGAAMTVDSSGIRYVDLRAGQGAQPDLDDRIECHFRGMLVDGTIINDTFRDGQPTTKRVSELILGLRNMFTNMNEGGLRAVIVPPDLAFGAVGIPGRVPRHAHMVFEIELLRVLPPS